MAIKIFISAGEPSGDKHAAKLMRAIKASFEDVSFIGIGGEEMEAEGLKSIISIKDISVVGFWEVAKNYRMFSKLINQCKDILRIEKPDLFIPVDYPGFNIRLAKYAKSINIKVAYYIAPQLWAWGRNRANKLRSSVDKLLVVFPFEERFFKSFDIDTTFVGHPLMEDQAFKNLPKKDKKLIALMPGSRTQEIKNHLKLFLDVTLEFDSSYRFGLAKSKNVSDEHFKIVENYKNIEIWEDSRELMKNAVYGVVKTGTSNLEAALCEMPFSMVYKTSFLTYQLAKQLINLDYISLVNILANKLVVPELIQSNASSKIIAKSIKNNLENIDNYKFITSEFEKIKNRLGQNSASEKSTQIIKRLIT
ncbi:lipid-A-disaccharide synthase [Candidatus Kapabacteria bacterium]|nr:lipid-A-disaccharide synthase [Candidatus Kapabacteria bacterium]